ncbi:MAG: phage holin family protein [Candidatus Cloacimonetes bacterium]|nr:phage holin family protein [Candidatus Cloacimonadota bacterium]
MLVSFIVNLLVSAGVLSILPMARYKDFSSCFIVSLAAAIIGTLLSSVHIIVTILISPFLLIPFFGPLLVGVPALILTSFLVNAVALYIADQMIEDFEIDGFVNTAIASLCVSLAIGLVNFIF